MANDLVKGAVKIVTAIIAGAFTTTVAGKGVKNVEAWKKSQKQIQKNSKNG